MKNKREIIVSVVSLLFGGLITYFILQNYISNSISQKSKIENIKTRSGTIIEAQTGSFNGNGKIGTVQLKLLSKYDGTNNAKLILIEDGREIFTKDVTLENNFGKLELVNLFGDDDQQILLTTGVGAHSLLGYFYQLTDNKLISLCPEDGQGADNNIDKKNDCAFFSDGAEIFSKDLNGDGVSEIIESGRDPENPTKIFKWDGALYKKVVGAEYDKMSLVLQQKSNY